MGCREHPDATGAVFKLLGSGNELAQKAEEVVGNLYFANGITFDRAETYMYVSESTMDRVLRFRVDVQKGTVSDREVYQTVYGPDNLAIDIDDNLWIASFFGNQVLAVDHTCQSVHKVFRADSKSHTAFLGKWVKRSHLGLPRGELLTPNAHEPLPNFLTGVFFSPNSDTVYITGLGDVILKYVISKDK